MRAFVAAIPPPEVVEHLDDFLTSRRDAAEQSGRHWRWTDPSQWHLTLAFSADVPDRALDDLEARLERAARKRRGIDVRFAGGGAFPHPHRAKVLWSGLVVADEGLVELDRMATGARAALGKAGAKVDGQRFRPHLTLARLGRPENVTSFVRVLDGYEGPTWTLGEVALVASYLGEGPRRRPRHEVIGTYPLA